MTRRGGAKDEKLRSPMTFKKRNEKRQYKSFVAEGCNNKKKLEQFKGTYN